MERNRSKCLRQKIGSSPSLSKDHSQSKEAKCKGQSLRKAGALIMVR